MLYVFNAKIVPIALNYTRALIEYKKLIVEEAKTLIREKKFISAVGHTATAELLSKLLDVEIPTNRITVELHPGDEILCFGLRSRLPEGKVLSKEELDELEYDLVYYKIVNAL
mgnify:CR=1 FL=1